MKAATVLLLLVVCCVVMHAQNSAPSADVTIRISADTPEYCLGEILSPPDDVTKRGPDDISLRLPLTVRYENRSSEAIILPFWTHNLTRMTVAGQDGSTVLRNVGYGGMNENAVMAMSRPEL